MRYCRHRKLVGSIEAGTAAVLQDTVPGHNKAAGQDIVLDFDSGIVPDTALGGTAVAGDTGWVVRIVRGRIAGLGYFVGPTLLAAGLGIARIGAAWQDPRSVLRPERMNLSLVRTRTLQIKE